MADFSIITGHLYKMENNEILRRYVHEFKRGKILAKAHGVAIRGHYVGYTIV